MTEQPGDYTAKGANPPAKTRIAKFRVEAETKDDLDVLVLCLEQVLDIVEESRDYSNRDGRGIRRYLSVVYQTKG